MAVSSGRVMETDDKNLKGCAIMLCSIENLPLPAAAFGPLEGKGEESGLYFSGCNALFRAAVGGDIIGKSLGQLPEKLQYFGDMICHSLQLGGSSFQYFINGAFYDVCFKKDREGYILCMSRGKNSCADKLEKAVNAIPEGIILLDCSGVIIFINQSAKAITGLGDSITGKPAENVLNFYNEGSAKKIDPAVFKSPGSAFSGYFYVRRGSGAVALSANVVPVEPGETGGGVVISFRDASMQKKREKEVIYLSYHDSLTNLYNRAYFNRVKKGLDNKDHYPLSLIIGDANGLKFTNDVYGHFYGDMLLTTIAGLFKQCCRKQDIICRYGGDEFIVLMPHTTAEEAAAVCGEIHSLCRDKRIKQNRVSVSTGYACKDDSTESIESMLRRAEDYMYRNKLQESKNYRSSVISSLKETLYEKSCETEEHAVRITGLCEAVGRLMGLNQKELNDLEMFSMLHDIGKIGIKDEILQKPGPLSDHEWAEMRKHSEIGYRIAHSTVELSGVAEYILCHHERWDGTGYPQGLKGENIPLLSRILSVADAYDAMVNNRAYRKAMSKEAAVEELKKNAGTQFDPRMVEAFLSVLG